LSQKAHEISHRQGTFSGCCCNGCGRRIGRVRSSRERTWDDLPWAAHHVTLVYRQRRIVCRACGIRAERIEFADPKARVTRRLRQQIGVDCQSMPTRPMSGTLRAFSAEGIRLIRTPIRASRFEMCPPSVSTSYTSPIHPAYTSSWPRATTHI